MAIIPIYLTDDSRKWVSRVGYSGPLSFLTHLWRSSAALITFRAFPQAQSSWPIPSGQAKPW